MRGGAPAGDAPCQAARHDSARGSRDGHGRPLLLTIGAVALLVGLAGGLTSASGWWTLPACWLASTAASTCVYLLGSAADGALLACVAVATVVCCALAGLVSWRGRPRTPPWQTLLAALGGVLTPFVLGFAWLATGCDGCLS